MSGSDDIRTVVREKVLAIGDGLRVVVVGAAIGLLGALAGGRLLEATLHGVSQADPLSLGGAARIDIVVTAAVGVIFRSAWLPKSAT